MALRIGQPSAASYPAVLPEEPITDGPVEEVPALLEEGSGLTDGSAVEWIQEALDLCKGYDHSDDLQYALEQALVHLVGPSAVGATEPAETPTEEVPVEPIVDEDEEA